MLPLGWVVGPSKPTAPFSMPTATSTRSQRDGRVLTAPFLFTDLYHHHADSWTVPPEQSLLDACGESRRGVRLTATITFSADFKTVTLQPNSNPIGAGATYYFEISYQAQLWDVGGNVLNYGYIQFTTQ